MRSAKPSWRTRGPSSCARSPSLAGNVAQMRPWTQFTDALEMRSSSDAARFPWARRAEISSPTLTAFASLSSLPSESKTRAYPRSRIARGESDSRAVCRRSLRTRCWSKTLRVTATRAHGAAVEFLAHAGEHQAQVVVADRGGNRLPSGDASAGATGARPVPCGASRSSSFCWRWRISSIMRAKAPCCASSVRAWRPISRR